MKYRAILYVISLLLIFLSFGMGISSAVSFIMSDPDALVYRFSGCAAWTFVIGYALLARKCSLSLSASSSPKNPSTDKS